MPRDIAIEQIKRLTALSPSPDIQGPFPVDSVPVVDDKMVDLDSPEELASRSLLLGILYRTIGEHKTSRQFFEDAISRQTDSTTSWIPAATIFELANLDLMEAEAASNTVAPSVTADESLEPEGLAIDEKLYPPALTSKEIWKKALDSASVRLDRVSALPANSPAMISRIESRASMLRDEIGYKKVELGI